VTEEFWAVIFLDWSGVDLALDPLHPASKLFYSRSFLELQYIYILKIEKLSVNIILFKKKYIDRAKEKE